MAFALVSTAATFADFVNGKTATSGSISAGGADLGILSIAGYNGFDTCAVSDSNGNTWVQRITASTTGGMRNDIWDCQGTFSNGMTVTVTGAHGGATYFGAAVQFFSGSQASAWGGTSNSGIGAGNTGSPGSLTPGVANCLVCTGIALYDSQTFGGSGAISGGFTIDAQYDGVHSVGLAHLIQTTASAASPTWSGFSFSGSQNVSTIGYWKPSTGSTPTNITPPQTVWNWNKNVPTFNSKTQITPPQKAWNWTGNLSSFQNKITLTQKQWNWNAFGPTINGTSTVTPPQKSWGWAGNAPTINSKTQITPPQKSWSWTGFAPSFNMKTMFTPLTVSWRWIGNAVTGFGVKIAPLLKLMGMGT